MDPIQHRILTALYHDKTDPNHLRPAGQELGNISVSEFERAWRALKEAGFVTGGIFRHFVDGEIKDLGIITPVGEEEIKRAQSSPSAS